MSWKAATAAILAGAVVVFAGIAVAEYGRIHSGGAEPLGPATHLHFNARNQPACLARGGEWMPYLQDASRGICRIRTPDAGKACAGSMECASYCLVKVGPEPPEIGEKVVGQCMPYYYYVGDCFDLVEDGRFDSRLCID